MEIAGYDLLTYVHILLFAYWLGADLGVFVGARVSGRPGLTYDQRVLLREAVMMVDMAPRSALILILPVGFQMAANWGSPIQGAWLLLIWIAAAIWFVIMWSVHVKAGTERGEQLRKLDMVIRYSVMVAMFGIGLSSWVMGVPFEPKWLATKAFLFGAIIALGIALRMIAKDLPPIMAAFKEGQDDAATQLLLNRQRKRGGRTALTLWGVLFVMAFLGTTKPF
jgi:hypothetical protein